MFVTDVPAQTGFEEAEIVMLTGRILFTVIVIGAPEAGFPEVHGSEEVNTQVI